MYKYPDFIHSDVLDLKEFTKTWKTKFYAPSLPHDSCKLAVK